MYACTYVCTYVRSTTGSHSLPEGHPGVGGGESLCLALSLQTLPQTTHKWNKDTDPATLYICTFSSTVNHMMAIASEYTSTQPLSTQSLLWPLPLLRSLHLDILWNMLYWSASSSIFSCRAALVHRHGVYVYLYVRILLYATEEARLWLYVMYSVHLCNTAVGMVQMCVG